MNKLWLVIKHEYLYNLKRPAFLFAAFGTPILIIAIMGLSIFIQTGSETRVSDLTTIGYVDNADVLSTEVQLPDYEGMFVPYETEESVRTALDEETIDLYFVIHEDYLNNALIQVMDYDSAPINIESVLEDLLIANLVDRQSLGDLEQAVVDGVDMTVYLQDSDRELDADSIFGIIIFPMIFGIIFVIATQVTSGFLMSGLVDERVNRIIEVLVTSVTPMQLLVGKIIGLFLLGLTQLLVWLMALFIVLLFAGDVPILSGIVVPVDLVVYALLYFVFAYLAVASFMGAIGAVANSEQESRQYSIVITLPLFSPFVLLAVFFTEPNGTLATILSIVPLTSPMAMVLRLGIGSVPFWQIALSLGLLLLTAMVFMFGGIRVFRWGMLLHGKPFNLLEIWRVLRGKANKNGLSQPQNQEVSV